jgi:C-terminal processing protease CtpA/Prc
LSVRGTSGALSTLTLTADTMEIREMGGSRFRQLYSQAKDSAEVASSHVQVSIADSVFVWRLPHFAAIDKGLGDVIKRARKHPVLIMDLRGNPGGSIETLTKLLGFFMDQELMVGDLRLRTTKEKFIAKPRSDRITGRVFIVVDSETASAAEIFARIMQLQGKATVLGDRTAGMVMASQYFPADEEMGAFITVSDFVLYNGERLEKVGVKPDVLAVETPQHVAAAGDPVLALALLRAGVRMNAAMARQLMQRAN